GKKLNHSMLDKTVGSGNRGVKYKTEYPDWFRFIVNEYLLFPFIVLQEIFKRKEKGMVLYVEFGVGPYGDIE
ncbi:hypothetical protein ACFL4I_01370, partial [Pseudomonadota bacterium]